MLTALGGRRIVRPVDGRFEIFHDVLAEAVLSWRTRHDAQRELERERARRSGVTDGSWRSWHVLGRPGRDGRRRRRLLHAALRSPRASRCRTGGGDEGESQRARRPSQRPDPITAPSTDPELGLLLAAEAARLSPDPRTAGVLRRALLLSHLRGIFPERDVTTASLSQDGAHVVVTESGLARVYADEGRRVATTLGSTLPQPGRPSIPTRPSRTHDGEWRPRTGWNATTGTELLAIGGSPESASFGPDGSRILTVDEGTARVWEADDARWLPCFASRIRSGKRRSGPAERA